MWRGHNGVMNRLRLTLAIVLGAVLVAVAAAFTSHHSTPTAAVSPAVALQKTFVDVYRHVSPSVVQLRPSNGLGSGIVFDSQGNIVTNAHVVSGPTRFTV